MVGYLVKFNELLGSESQLEKLLLRMPAEMELRSYVKNIVAGSTLMRKGEKIRYVYILINGEVKVINEFENGRMYIYARIISINFIGELEILAGEMKHASTVEAVTDCKLLAIIAEDFARWIQADHSVLMVVCKGLAEKMYPTSSENGTIMFLSGKSKVQDYIVKQYKERRRKTEMFLLNKTRQQIADEIGISVKTVNRCIEKLKLEELIVTKKGKIHINREQYGTLLLKKIKKAE